MGLCLPCNMEVHIKYLERILFSPSLWKDNVSAPHNSYNIVVIEKYWMDEALLLSVLCGVINIMKRVDWTVPWLNNGWGITQNNCDTDYTYASKVLKTCHIKKPESRIYDLLPH